MRKIMIFTLMLTTALAATAQRQQVSRQEAESAALTRVRGNNPSRNVSIIDVTSLLNTQGDTILYEIETDQAISVILSGNKACLPILGVHGSMEGSYLQQYDSLPEGLRFLLDCYSEQIDSCFRNGANTIVHEEDWQRLIHGQLPFTSRYGVSPLLGSFWSQREPNNTDGIDAYNYLMDGDSNCSHYLAGCVAVAMGQVMYYWKYPVLRPDMENHQFDWCNMTDKLNTTSPSYERNRDAISYLLKKCGESVNMDYGCNASGAHLSDVADVLINDFNYHDGATYKLRLAYSDDDWKAMLRNELNESRPVIYGGQSQLIGGSAHAFVCDGYNEYGEFHFNWGWGSNNSGPNDYFTLDNLTPDNHNYNYWQRAIVGIKPNISQEMCDYHLQLSHFYNWFYTTGNYITPPPYGIVPQTMTVLQSADIIDPEEWRTIPSGEYSEYVAHKTVLLEHGFTVERGADFVARIEPCAYCESNNREETMAENPMANAPNGITEKEYSNPTISASFDLGIDTLPVYSSKEYFTLTPNPTDGNVVVEVKNEKSGEATITLCDATGREVLKQKASTPTTRLDLSALPAGTYFVTVTIGGQTGTRKLVVK